MFVFETEFLEQSFETVNLIKSKRSLFKSKHHFNFSTKAVLTKKKKFYSTKCLILISLFRVDREVSFYLAGSNHQKEETTYSWTPIPAPTNISSNNKLILGPWHTAIHFVYSFDIRYKYIRLFCDEMVGGCGLTATAFLFTDLFVKEV